MNPKKGKRLLKKNSGIQEIHAILEKRLSDDPIREVRLEIGKSIKHLKLFDRIFAQMEK